MPELIYALICADLIIDKDSSSTSFIRTIEHAVVPEFPATLPPIYFASLWDLENAGKDPFTVSLNLMPPGGEMITLGLQEVTPSGTMPPQNELPAARPAGQGRRKTRADRGSETGRRLGNPIPASALRVPDRQAIGCPPTTDNGVRRNKAMICHASARHLMALLRP